MDKEILKRVKQQFAADCGIVDKSLHIAAAPAIEKGRLSDAAFGEDVREALRKRTGAVPRIYEGISPFFRAIVMGKESWIMADEQILGWCEKEYRRKDMEWFGQFEQLDRLNRQLRRFGHEIADCRVCMLPSAGRPETGEKEDGSDRTAEKWRESLGIRFLTSSDILDIRDPYPFRHALCDSELMPCRLAAAAIRDGQIIGIAGATQDCPQMMQIGVDVLSVWKGNGIGSGLVKILKEEILSRGMIPFYSTSQSHIVSLNTALRAGFVPAWAEVFVK